jgi:flagellar hook-basal body complex protein FliE
MPSPAENISNVISAYNNVARSGLSESSKSDEAQQGDGFADLVKGAIKEAIKIGEESEKMSIAGIQDKADLNQVVTAVAEAEVTLQTVVAVRDKVIDAYKEILRMPM